MFDAATDRLPFQPMRDRLYGPRELTDGFSDGDPHSWLRSVDFRSYRHFVLNGRSAATSEQAGMMQALHDNAIRRAMWRHVRSAGRAAVAIMGGHGEKRGSATYRQVAAMAKRLTERGFLMASGGGPGCMEATHLGALLAGRPETEQARVLRRLTRVPTLPDTRRIVRADGSADLDQVAALHRWMAPAIGIMQEYAEVGGQSLAIPTWHYGHEPSSPLATHVAKFFLNSIREDALLALATGGIVFAPGRAGTLQEVFQGAAQNYYDRAFAPMVFLDERFWSEELPVRPLLEGLFVGLNGMPRDEFDAKVLITSDVDRAVAFLQQARSGSGATDRQASRILVRSFGSPGGRVGRAAMPGGPALRSAVRAVASPSAVPA
jgi:predicted Rossmann-fold nucleotide-binding protein